MHASSNSPSIGSTRACDAEPIHVPGSIQPHGLLLLFDAGADELMHWAGDPEYLLGTRLTVGMRFHQIFATAPGKVIHGLEKQSKREATFAGYMRPRARTPLSVMVHRTGSFVAVELEPADESAQAATALQRVRDLSAEIACEATLEAACQRAAEAVQTVTGYDHVMVYRFGDDHSGSVLAESRTGNAVSYLHHRFPASDIPHQARELYRRNTIRVIADVSYAPSAIQPAVDASTIDLTHSTLRSVSPVHIRYLKNMGVGASMSVSLLVDGELWGLIACHHSAARTVPAEAQLMCRHVGEALSAFIGTGNLTERARRSEFQSSVLEHILGDLRSSSDPEKDLRSSAEHLRSLVDSGGLALLAEGELVAGAGRLPNAETLRRLDALVGPELEVRQCFATDRLDDEIGGCPEAVPLASGVLAIRIVGIRPLVAMWTRPEQIEEVAWAGNPGLKEETGYPAKALTPRNSFATWREIVRGRSRPWTWEERTSVEAFKARAEFILQRHRLEQVNQQLSEANRHLETLATTDPLTGLPNRRLFDERLQVEWARCLRSRRQLALIAIDIDNFKKFNDRFGHPAGDECLKRVAKSLGGACRTADVAARLGGEEFALLLPDIDAGAASGVAERVRRTVEQLAIAHPLNPGGVVTVSLGLVEGTPTDWRDLPTFLRAADEGLYEAKASGRNQFVSKLPVVAQ